MHYLLFFCLDSLFTNEFKCIFLGRKAVGKKREKKNLVCKVDGSEGDSDCKCYLSLQNDWVLSYIGHLPTSSPLQSMCTFFFPQN